jgi:hypothetical protein
MTAAPVVAVLDDAASGGVLLDMSAAIAGALERDLSLVYVESMRSISAAALPSARVLAHAGSAWLPLTTTDVERGFLLQAARLREMASRRLAAGPPLRWTLEIVRGELHQTARELALRADITFMATTGVVTAPARPRRQPVVAVAADSGAAAARASEIASRLALALHGIVTRWPGDPAGAATTGPVVAADVVVIPRGAQESLSLAALRCPVLLVG